MTCSTIWKTGLGGCVRRCKAAIIAVALSAAPAQAEALKVFAAASLTDALDEALPLCIAGTSDTATGVYAGSGTIARQIDQGAPANLFISANPQWMDWLEQRGMIAPETRVDLLGNALVVVSVRKQDSGLDTDQNKTWAEVIGTLDASKIAVADMESVPAGIYSKQALESAGLLDRTDVRDRLVQSASVREAFTWVVRRELGLGFVYKTDALTAPDIRAFAVPPDAHDPIRYPAAVVADNDSPNARRLLDCLQGEEASGVFRRYGFIILAE